MGLLSSLGLKAPATSGGAPAKLAAEPASAPVRKNDSAQLLERHKKLKGDLDRLIAKGGPLATGPRARLDDFRKALAAKKFDAADTVLDRLEELIWLDTGKAPPGDAPAKPAAPADPVAAALDEHAGTVEDLIAAISEEPVKTLLRNELAAFRESRAKAEAGSDPKKRGASLKTLVPQAKKLADKAAQLGIADQLQRDAAAARGEVDAMRTQITALVLGGIGAAGPRDKVNAELKKLDLAIEKAARTKDAKAALAAWNAIKPAARDLLGKAQAAAGAGNWAEGQLAPLIASAKTAIAGVAAAAPKAALTQEIKLIEAEVFRLQKADDIAALQGTLAPRAQKLHRFVTALGAASAQADAELGRAEQLIAGFDAGRSVEIRASLKTLQEHKKTAWPAGSTVDEMDAAAKTFASRVRALITEAEVLKLKLDSLKDVDALRKRVEALKDRTDKANDAPVPKFIENAQKDVRDRLAATLALLDQEDLKKAEAAFGGLVASLDRLETFKSAWDKFRQKLAAAKAGGIKAILDLKLEPAELAKTRNKAIRKGEAEIVALAESGYVTKAIGRIDEWLAGAKAWAGAKEAYDNMRSAKPSADAMAKLAKAPGGGPVLDALVADLPDDIPQEVLTEAVQARYGIKVKQYDHRDGKGSGGKRTAANPKTPDKALKGLYSVLGKVPLKDTAKVKSIDRYSEESGGAAYGGGEIDLYCGRPDDGNVQEFNKKGEVVPEGEKIEKNCEPINPKAKISYFDFATLHEVGHAVDDSKKIMKGGRNADAGWEAPSAADIAAVAAGHFKFDAAYLEAMIKSKTSAPPATKPTPPGGTDGAAWDLARQKAEDWVKSVRVDAGLWWHAADCKRLAIGGRVYHEAYAGSWVSYKLSARAQGVTGYQFRSPMEWFAELYAAYFMQKMNPKHPAASWLAKLKAEAN